MCTQNFDHVCKQRKIMYKPLSPPCKGWLFMFENPRIPYHPDMPPGSENYLSKKWLVKRFPGLKINLHHMRRWQPFNLKEVPNPTAEITQEE